MTFWEIVLWIVVAVGAALGILVLLVAVHMGAMAGWVGYPGAFVLLVVLMIVRMLLEPPRRP